MRIEPKAASVKPTDFSECATAASTRAGDVERRNPSDRWRHPLVTIAVPTRNRAFLAGEAVRRALAQSYSNIEVLVSDNASTDDTLATLRSITDPRLRVLTSEQDIGNSANYAECIREAKGEFLLLVPDDDRISGTFVESCVGLINEDPGIQAVVGAYGVFFAGESRSRPAILSRRLSTGIWDGSEVLKEFLRGHLSAIMLSVVARTELLRDGIWDSDYQTADDVLAMGRILLSGRVGLLNEQCATLTIHNSSVSTCLGLDHGFRETQEVMEVISETAARVIPDQASRREVQDLTARYVAKKLFDFLVLYRRQGVELRDVARQLRIWRRQSPRCSLAHFAAAARLRTLALLLSPAPLTQILVSLRETLQARDLPTT